MPFWVWLLLGIGALAAVAGFLSRPIHRRHRTLGEVTRLVDSFLRGMDTGAVWIADREAGPGFLQLALVDNQTLQQVIELGIPDVDWSASRFDAVMEAVQTAGFTAELETSGTDPIPRFLRVRCAGQRPQLTETALRMLAVVAQALGWETHETYTVHWGGTLPGPQTWREILDGLDRVSDNGMTRRLRRFATRQLGRHDR
jgi:hypothetical protein